MIEMGKERIPGVQSTRIVDAKWNNCFVMQLSNRNKCFVSKQMTLSEKGCPETQWIIMFPIKVAISWVHIPKDYALNSSKTKKMLDMF